MSILIDSVLIDEIRQAMATGFVSGVTTNPSLMAPFRSRVDEQLAEILAASVGPVFCQVTSENSDDWETEGQRAHALAPDRVVLKIPATTGNMALIARLSGEVACAATAVYSPAQALAACEAGARFLIPYVSRATRLMGDGCKLVSDIAAVVAANSYPAEILAASIKSPDEAVAATRAGARHLTLPLQVILALGNHSLSDEAIDEFREIWNRASGQG